MISLAPTLAPPTPDYLYALLSVVSNPALAKQHLDALAAAQAGIVAEQGKLADLETRAAAIAKDRAAADAAIAEQQAKQAVRAAEFDRRQAQVDDGFKQLAVARQEHAAAVDALQKSQTEHEAQLKTLNLMRAQLKA